MLHVLWYDLFLCHNAFSISHFVRCSTRILFFMQDFAVRILTEAVGGISSLDDAEKFLSLGADRLGTSRIVKIVKNEEATGY